MGQSTSQLPSSSQDAGFERTPTPELSDLDTADAPPLSTTVATTSQASKTIRARAKVAKRPGTSTRRSLRIPRLTDQKTVLPFAGDREKEGEGESQVEMARSSARRIRRTLPEAVILNEDEGPATQPFFDTTRRARPSCEKGKNYRSSRSQSQVYVPSSEIIAATPAQALGNRVGDPQEQSSQVQHRPQFPVDGMPEHEASSNMSVLARGENSPDDSLVAADRPLLERGDNKKGAGEAGFLEDGHSEECAEVDDQCEADSWPNPSDEEVQSLLGKRRLTAADREMEAPIEAPQSTWDKHDQARRRSRNRLRKHIIQLNIERKIYRGYAKRVTDQDGKDMVIYANDGEKFPVAKHTKAEKRAAKARKQDMIRSNAALLESIVRSELEARMMAASRECEKAGFGGGRDLAVGQSPGSLSLATIRRAHCAPSTGHHHLQAEAEKIVLDQVESGALHMVDQNAASVSSSPPDKPLPDPRQSDGTADPRHLPAPPAIAPVDNWLASQDDVQPPLAKAARTRKRNSDDVDCGPESSDFVPEGSTSTKSPPRASARGVKMSTATLAREGDRLLRNRPAKRRKTRGNSVELSAQAPRQARTSGQFTHEEKELADKIYDSVLQNESIRPAELTAQIKNWKTCGAFKERLLAAFPDRSGDCVRKFAQRRYHNQERGPWTQAQDDALRSAYSSQPGKWTVISGWVGRTASDCKDRWRNHLESGLDMQGPWTLDEEEALLTAVNECLEIIKRENAEDAALVRDRERLEALISWRVVCDKLKGKRSAKKCREKYPKLRMAQAKVKNDLPWSDSKRAREEDGDPERVALAKRQVENFEIGDYYDVFVEIHSSFDNPHQRFRDEKNVVWSIVSQKNLYSRFNLYSHSSSLRRVALETALEKWPVDNEKIKKRLERADTIPAKALVLANWIERRHGNELDSILRTYHTELIGKSREEMKAIRNARKKKFACGLRKRGGISKDYVSDSEKEELLGNSPVPPFEISLEDPRIPSKSVPAAGDAIGCTDPELEPGERDYVSDSEEHATKITHEAPDTQFQGNNAVMTNVQSVGDTPSIQPSEFANILKSSSRRKTVGYGKKDRWKAERRRTRG